MRSALQGQANHFVRYAPEKIEYGMKRYTNEAKRLYEVMDAHLKDHEWLAAGEYTIAGALPVVAHLHLLCVLRVLVNACNCGIAKYCSPFARCDLAGAQHCLLLRSLSFQAGTR